MERAEKTAEVGERSTTRPRPLARKERRDQDGLTFVRRNRFRGGESFSGKAPKLQAFEHRRVATNVVE
jgi:hypothetical protein